MTATIADARTNPRWRGCAHTFASDRCTGCGVRRLEGETGTPPAHRGTFAGVSVGYMQPVMSGGALPSERGGCPKGHPAAMRYLDSAGHLSCRVCHRKNNRDSAARKRARAA